MLRPLTRNVAVRRLASTHIHNTHSLVARRHLVVPTPSLTRSFASSPQPPTPEKTQTPNVVPIPPQTTARKPNIDLRPAPRKPNTTTLSATHTPTKATPRSQPASPNSTSNNATLASVKEATRRDIEDAEAHGVLAPPPPDANWFKRTMHKGIQLFKFYYRGVKLIFIRRGDIARIRARVRAGGLPLSRWENRIIRTQKDDINKVIPFLFIALLLEEVIPLIAIYAPFMLPSTCILPSQRERIQEKKTEKAIALAEQYRSLLSQLESKQDPPGHLSMQALRSDDAPLAVCGLLKLTTTGFDALRLRRIRKHLEFITTDDSLLLQDNLLGHLSEKELTEALEERGFLTRGLDLKAKDARLRWWLESISKAEDPISRRLYMLVKRW